MCQPGWEGVSGRMDTCICTAEFLHCSPKVTTTLLTGNILVQNKKFKVWGKKSTYPHLTLFTWVKQLFYNLHAWKWSRFCRSGFICIVFFFLKQKCLSPYSWNIFTWDVFNVCWSPRKETQICISSICFLWQTCVYKGHFNLLPNCF